MTSHSHTPPGNKKRLKLLLVIAGLMILTSLILTTEVTVSKTTRYNTGPVKLLPPRRMTNENEVLLSQREAWTNRLATMPASLPSSFTNCLLMEITNPGPQTVTIFGYNAVSPYYLIYIGGSNGTERITPPTQLIRNSLTLAPAESLRFPVQPPPGDRLWQVVVSYSNPLPPPKPATQWDLWFMRLRRYFPFPRIIPPSWYTISEPIHTTNSILVTTPHGQSF